MTRLTVAERADRALSGTDLQRQITDLAQLYGWEFVHFRAAPSKRGWRVPVEGPLGAGWPDLFLASGKRRRVLAVEVKRELGDPVTPDQVRVHTTLREAGLEVVVWRPSDMTAGRIEAVLR